MLTNCVVRSPYLGRPAGLGISTQALANYGLSQTQSFGNYALNEASALTGFPTSTITSVIGAIESGDPVAVGQAAMSATTISPQRLAELCQAGTIDLIDVRTPVEFREVHVTHARNVPLDRLDPAALPRGRSGSKDEPVYLICRSGSRGRQACEKFLAAGFPNVVNVEGGTLAWAQCGLPVVRGRKAISLERQVRIAAGLLVLLGALLGWLIHPAFVGLAAIVGAGLVFAGITDTCGMGLLLARMPWNQVKESSSPCFARKEVRP